MSAEMFRIYVAGTSGACAELPGRFSDASDVEALYARFCERFPQVREIASRVACGRAGAEAVVEFIGRAYRIADTLLDEIPPQADSGFDSWCPREDGTGTKYWDRVPLNAMISAGYFNCLFPAAMAARAFTEAGSGFALLVCPAVPTHPYVWLPGMPHNLFSFHHDGLRQFQGNVEIRNIRYAPESLMPISDYGTRDGIYGLSVPEHFLILTRLVPAVGDAGRVTEDFADLAAGLDSYPRLAVLADVVRRSVIPRLRSGPVPFPRTLEDG